MILLAGFIFIASCKKEKEEDPKDNTPAGTAMDAFFKNNRLSVQKFKIFVDGLTSDTVTGAGGIRIIFPSACFLNGMGLPDTGTYDITLKEVIKKADMILGGVNMYSGDSVIVSSGMIYLDARKNGVRPTIDAINRISVEVAQVGSQRFNFKTFNGASSGSDSTNWVVDDKSRGVPSGTSYLISSSSLGWINCDRFYGNGNNAKFTVTLPSGYTNANASVFLVFTQDHTITRMYGNQSLQLFDFGNYAGIPAGSQVKVLVIASQGNQLQYAEQNYTAAAGNVTISSFTNTTEAAMKTYLNGL